MHLFKHTLPTPDTPKPEYYKQNYFYWQNCASNQLVDSIISIGESLEQSDAQIGTSVESSSLVQSSRISNISWIRYNESSEFLFDFITDKIDRINFHHYGMNLHGMEEFQFARYNPGGHYVYHNDIIVNNGSMRKLSLVLCLSDSSEYTGGDFLLMPYGCNPETIRFQKGDLIAFPSWVPHKVEPVTTGLRRTLVTWVYGPTFI